MSRLQWKESLIQFFFFLTGILSVAVLMGIFVMLLWNASAVFQDISLSEFFFRNSWNPSAYGAPSYGILSMVVSTFYVTLGAMVFAVPLGIATAAFLSEIASPRVREILKPMVEILAGIPSVTIGFLGIILVSPAIAKVFGLSNGLNSLNGAILLAVMSLPTIISVSEDAIRSIPKEYKEGSYALGATKWTTLILVTLPGAKTGIVVAIMLGIGRAIGETMTVLMVTGNANAMPHSIFDSAKTMTSTIAIELGEVPYGTIHYEALFAIGAVLFIISFFVNLIAELVTVKRRKH